MILNPEQILKVAQEIRDLYVVSDPPPEVDALLVMALEASLRQGAAHDVEVTDHAGRELHLLSGARAPITMIAELANPIDVAPPFGPSGNLVIVRVPENCYIGVVKEKS